MDPNSRNDFSNNSSGCLCISQHEYVLLLLPSIYSSPDEVPSSATLECLFFLTEAVIHDRQSYSNDIETNFLITSVTVLEQYQQGVTRQLLVIRLLRVNKEQSIIHT